MPIPDLEPRQLTEREKVEDWREASLVDAGYPPDAAIALARDVTVDLHKACALLANGCDLATALKILS